MALSVKHLLCSTHDKLFSITSPDMLRAQMQNFLQKNSHVLDSKEFIKFAEGDLYQALEKKPLCCWLTLPELESSCPLVTAKCKECGIVRGCTRKGEYYCVVCLCRKSGTG